MRMTSRFLLPTSLLALAVAPASLYASPSLPLDGAITPGDNYTLVGNVQPYINGTDASGGTQDVSLYWNNAHPNHVVGAIQGDPSKPTAFTPANIYLYSSGASINQNTLATGAYGDGDDIIINGSAGYSFSLNAAPWGTSPVSLVDQGGGLFVSTDGLVSIFFNAATLTEEFVINRSLLGNYDQLRFGGQLFAYEFNRGSGDRQAGALVPAAVPEPASLALLALAAPALLTRRRKA